MALIYLCLGSNKDDRVGLIQQATRLLSAEDKIRIIRTSTMYETEPWGNKPQEWFINGIIEAKTKLSPAELLELCNSVERQLGRDRTKEDRWSERAIDIDILFYDDLVIDTEELRIPHQHLHQRAFAIVPLLELIPDFVHPIYDKTLLELHDEIEDPEDVFLYGTRIDV